MVVCKCKQCGKEFKTVPAVINKGNGKYCSKECYNKTFPQKVKCNCLECNKEFYVTPSRLKERRGKYCSKKCQYKAKNTTMTHRCKVCGNVFTTTPYYIKRGGGNYCSHKCYGTFVSNKQEMNCLNCGKKFYANLYQTKKGRGKFCSATCFAIHNNSHNIKNKETKIEGIIKDWLLENNISFTPQFSTGVNVADFFVSPNYIIECDGDYWHGDKFPKTQRKDEQVTKKLTQLGYNVIRLTETEILSGKRPIEVLH